MANRYGAGVPVLTLGSVGDQYIDQTSFSVYQKTDFSTWTLVDSPGPMAFLNSYEDLTVGAASPGPAVSLSVYQTHLITAGVGKNLDIGLTAVVGQRKLITLKTLTTAGDTVLLDPALFSRGSSTITAITFSTVNDFLLCEWQGSSVWGGWWEIIVAFDNVVTTA